MAKNESKNLVKEGAGVGRTKAKSSKYVTIKVSVAWGGLDDLGDDEEQYLDDVGLPGSVYVKVPRDVYEDESAGLNMSAKLEATFDGYVDDYDYREVKEQDVPKGVPVYLWSDKSDYMEEF